jgi:hypothetical protein
MWLTRLSRPRAASRLAVASAVPSDREKPVEMMGGGGCLSAAGRYSPRQTGPRFSRNAVIPSFASCASAFSVMTSSQCS